jgi:glycine cleavage system aminomethyltransferase T
MTKHKFLHIDDKMIRISCRDGRVYEWSLDGDKVNEHTWIPEAGPISSSGMIACEGPDAPRVFRAMTEIAGRMFDEMKSSQSGGDVLVLRFSKVGPA